MSKIDWNAVLFQKSHDSGSGACVEVGVAGDVIGVRDSKLGTSSPVLEFNQAEWNAFKSGVRKGQFD